ncbi:MAG: insulinase family protein [Alicyclobacillus sp.]|nr:insulinase family protein [Alicyclobacillus sp.]
MAEPSARLHDIQVDQLENGMEIVLLPKPGFQQVYAMFTTRYGSVDTTFRVGREEPFTTVPEGIAHFLEHKMFESESGDVFSAFAAHGASANAFTTFEQTSYLFSCTNDAEENLKILLDFVQDPYFTDENVEKEKGIIGQEIRMYDDNPDWRCFFNLLKAMYHQHPVRIDIAGTVESIAQIDKDMLYRCYRTFYHPSNMLLVVAGGFDADRMLEVIRANQANKSFGPPPQIERQTPVEPPAVNLEKTVAQLSASQPRCLIGWKDANVGLTGRALLEQELLTGVVLDALFGRSSGLYHELIDDQLIDQQFTWEYDVTPSYGYALVGGNTVDPDALLARVDAALQTTLQTGLTDTSFERSRRKAVGRFVTSLDSPTYVARTYTSYALKDANFFDTITILESLTLDAANDRCRDMFVPAQRSVSIVQPLPASS